MSAAHPPDAAAILNTQVGEVVRKISAAGESNSWVCGLNPENQDDDDMPKCVFV